MAATGIEPFRVPGVRCAYELRTCILVCNSNPRTLLDVVCSATFQHRKCRVFLLQQQMHAQQLPHAGHAPPIPMMPHPGLPGPPVTAAASLLGLAGAAGGAAHPLSMLGAKPTDLHRGADSDKPSSAIGKFVSTVRYDNCIMYSAVRVITVPEFNL